MHLTSVQIIRLLGVSERLSWTGCHPNIPEFWWKISTPTWAMTEKFSVCVLAGPTWTEKVVKRWKELLDLTNRSSC